MFGGRVSGKVSHVSLSSLQTYNNVYRHGDRGRSCTLRCFVIRRITTVMASQNQKRLLGDYSGSLSEIQVHVDREVLSNLVESCNEFVYKLLTIHIQMVRPILSLRQFTPPSTPHTQQVTITIMLSLLICNLPSCAYYSLIVPI